jgi:predicted CDP-diglyceride synthetase/phosphatidate cytidylyltransferase
VTEVFWILGGLFTAASVASLIGYALHRRYPESPAVENFNARIRAWWLMIAIGGTAWLAGHIAIVLLFSAIMLLALRECIPPPGRWDIQSVGGVLCVCCLAYVPALLMLPIKRPELLVVFLVLIAQVSDIFQYVWGKLLGRHRIAPKLSPSKTLEGLIGGILSASALGALLWRITPFNMWQAGLMALTIAILGFLGGLVMSAIKRHRGIKDWGALISGHGGMLDRVDSLCLSAPAFFHLTRHYFSVN